MTAITTQWDNQEKTVIQITITDGWVWDDLYNALNIVKQMSVSVPQAPLGLIFNMERTSYHPIGVDKHLKRVLDNVHPNIVYFMMVGTNIWLTGVHKVMTEVNSELAESYRLVPTLEEARRFLNHRLTDVAKLRR